MSGVAYVEVLGGLEAPCYALCVGRRDAAGAVARLHAAYGFGAFEGSSRFGAAAIFGGLPKEAATVATL